MIKARNRNTMHYRNALLNGLLEIAYNLNSLQELTNTFLDVSTMHWRLCETIKPLEPEEILSLLSQPIDNWLPEFVCQGYQGSLLIGNKPSILAEVISYDLNYKDSIVQTKSSIDVISKSLINNGVAYNTYEAISQFLLSNPTISSCELESAKGRFSEHVALLYAPLSDQFDHTSTYHKCKICNFPYTRNSFSSSCISSFCKGQFMEQTAGHAENSDNQFYDYLPGSLDKVFSIKPFMWRHLYMPALIKNHFLSGLNISSASEKSYHSGFSGQAGISIKFSQLTKTINFIDWTDLTSLTNHLKFVGCSKENIIVVPSLVRAKIVRRGEYEVTCPEKLLRKISSLLN